MFLLRSVRHKELRMKSLIVGSVLALAVSISAGVSRGDSVTLHPNFSGFIGLEHNLGSGFTESHLQVTYTPTGETSSVIGAYNWTVQSTGGSTGSTTFPTSDQSIYTYCIQKTQSFDVGAYTPYPDITFSVGSVENSPVGGPVVGGDAGIITILGAQELQGLINSHWAESLTGNVSHTAAVNAAAFQLAVWEIEYDGETVNELQSHVTNTDYFSTGKIIASADVSSSTGAEAIAVANTWLKDLAAAPVTTAIALNSDTQQDFLTVVPIPAAFPMGFAMLAGIFAVRKLRNRS